MIFVRFTPIENKRTEIARALRGAVPGLTHKAATTAGSIGFIEVPAETVGDVVAVLKPLCTKVDYPTNDRDVAEARFVTALSKMEDRLATRAFNFLADVLDTLDTKPRK